MKRKIGILMAVWISLMMPWVVEAATPADCMIHADTAAGVPGSTVTIAVRIEGNPGFTNFAIALDYDREHLILKSIEGNTEDTIFCANPRWQGEDGVVYGYITAAAEEPVKQDGILFTAVFEIAAGYYGTFGITPRIQYLRNNEAVFDVFEQISAGVLPGSIVSVLPGDVNGDGRIEYDDVVLAYKAFLGEAELTEDQRMAADLDGSGSVEEGEYREIYQIYTGG